MSSSLLDIYIDLTESNRTIEKNMLLAICDHINLKLPSITSNIRKDIKNDVFDTFRNTSTYTELIGGSLTTEFGFYPTTAKDRIDSIIQAIVDAIEITYTIASVSGSSIKGGIEVKILKADMSDVLFLNEAIIYSRDGAPLNWLSWLLEEGNHYIIRGYQIRYEAGKGRSGGAIMVASNSGLWKVPTAYAGTIRNNWLTRALDSFGNYLASRIGDIIEAGIGD